MGSIILEKIDESIMKCLNKVAIGDVSSDETQKALDTAVKLHKLRTDELKIKSDDSKQVFENQKLTYDELARSKDEKERKKERWFRFGVAIAEVVVPVTVYGALSFIGYAREFDGTVCSRTLQNLANRISKR